MFFFADPMEFYGYMPTETYVRRPRYSSCAPCGPRFLFLLPLLLFVVGPVVSTLFMLALNVLSFLAPLVLTMLAVKAVFGCDDDQPCRVRRACYRGACKEKPVEKSEEADDKKSKSAAASYEILIAAPGVRAEDVTATLDHANVLRVSGRSATFGGKSTASVDRSVHLPSDADVSRIQISVVDGLVRVMVEKKAPRVLRVLPATAGSTAGPPASGRGRAIPIDKPGAVAPEPAAEEKSAQTSDAGKVASSPQGGAEAGGEAGGDEADSSEDDAAGFVEISAEEKKGQ